MCARADPPGVARGFVLLRHEPRTSVRRATLALFTGWMLITGLAFSFMAGIFHSYYTVALAPAKPLPTAFDAPAPRAPLKSSAAAGEMDPTPFTGEEAGSKNSFTP